MAKLLRFWKSLKKTIGNPDFEWQIKCRFYVATYKCFHNILCERHKASHSHLPIRIYICSLNLWVRENRIVNNKEEIVSLLNVRYTAIHFRIKNKFSRIKNAFLEHSNTVFRTSIILPSLDYPTFVLHKKIIHVTK